MVIALKIEIVILYLFCCCMLSRLLSLVMFKFILNGVLGLDWNLLLWRQNGKTWTHFRQIQIHIRHWIHVSYLYSTR